MISPAGALLFFHSLLSGDEAVVDSVITAGVVSLLALFVFQAYAVFVAHEPFNAITFSTGAGALVGAIGTSKGIRHCLSGPQATGGSDVTH